MTTLLTAGPAGPGLTMAWPGSPGTPLCTVTPTTDPEPCAQQTKTNFEWSSHSDNRATEHQMCAVHT